MKKLFLGLMMIFAFTCTYAQVAGTWKVASQPGSLGVGPTQGDISWWSIDAAGIIQRACFFDDKFVFNEDGSFQNVMDDWTWLEGWQGISPDQCGVPVFPHNGANAATWVYDEGAATIQLIGVGAHLGIPKVVNGSELTNPSQAPESITYLVTAISATSMTIDISIGAGWWRFIFEKEAASGEDATLSDLKVDGTTIDGFSPGITNYTYGLPEGTVEVPQITSATPTDPEVTSVVITQATEIPGDATVEVTSANGAVTLTYTVSFIISYDITLPVTFEDNIDYALTDFGGTVSEIIVDPTDPSNKVAKTIKTEAAETWAGTTIGGTVGFANAVPFAPGATVMTVRVWSPDANILVRLKVEDANDETHTVETQTNTTVAGDWEVITFDFANEAPGTEPIHFDWYFNKASIFFNFGITGAIAGEKTYYWDDVEFGGGGVEPKPYLANNVQDNFENDGYSTIPVWKFQDPDLVDITITEDPVNPGNHVLDYMRSGTFEWTNAQFILNHRMNLTERNVFEVKAYFPSSNDYTGDLAATLSLKLQNSLLGGEAWTTQTEVILTVDDFDTWVTLEYDFSAASNRDDYDQMVVQFGGEGHFAPGQFYFDDIKLLGDPNSIFETLTSHLIIYPNPASEAINISQFNELTQLEMFNSNGERVMQLNEIPQQIRVSDLPAGLYLILATDNNGGQFTTKFILQ
ncbi:MAG: T9SS type A sorting domain-containing protein [Bacteroidales bacterium]|nr:T9SS type A sorting domain-containing protein [Bacteroidales bacterium]